MTRLAAVVVAVLLVVGAVVVRGVLDDDGGGDDGSGDRGDGIVRVVCGDEVRAACDALASSGHEIRIESTATMAGLLATAPADDPGLDVWVVPAPWPEIVDGNRTRAGLPTLFAAATTLGRSDLVAIVPESIGPCDWSCLGDRSTDDLRFGGRSLASGLGLLHAAAFTAGRLGTTSYASNDLDTATQAWLRGVDAGIDEVPNPVTRMLQIRASFDVALTHRAEAETVLATASEDRRAGLSVTYPDPVISVVAVAALVDDADVPEGLDAALSDAGWTGATDDASGLPSAGVLTALLEVVG